MKKAFLLFLVLSMSVCGVQAALAGRPAPAVPKVYVLNSSGNIDIYDTSLAYTGKSVNLGGDYGFQRMVKNPANNEVYVSNLYGKLAFIDGKTDQVLGIMNLGPLGFSLEGMAVSPEGTRLYVAGNASGVGYFLAVDTAAMQYLSDESRQLPLLLDYSQGEACSIAFYRGWDQDRLFVGGDRVSGGSGMFPDFFPLYIYEFASGAWDMDTQGGLGAVPLLYLPWDIAVNTQGTTDTVDDRLYISGWGDLGGVGGMGYSVTPYPNYSYASMPTTGGRAVRNADVFKGGKRVIMSAEWGEMFATDYTDANTWEKLMFSGTGFSSNAICVNPSDNTKGFGTRFTAPAGLFSFSIVYSKTLKKDILRVDKEVATTISNDILAFIPK